MSAIFGERIICGQHDGDAVELVIFGDEFYARYETRDGYTVVYDTDVGCYCYVALVEGHFVSTGVRIGKPVPHGIRRHLKESPEVRNAKFLRRHGELRPPERTPASHAMRTLGRDGGLLEGRRLTEGDVRGLTILVEFDDVHTNIAQADVEAMLNGDDYSAYGNFCSAREYFRLVSSAKLNYTNEVVGPVRLPRRRSHYIQNLLVEEALDLALPMLADRGLSLRNFDSRGDGIVDALNVLYAGRTQYSGELWPHNSVTQIVRDGVRTHFYLLTSLGRNPVDLSIGTFCHENGHLLCRFPDMYDYGSRDGDHEDSEGIGQYCLMGSGNHNNSGRTPSPVCAYLRDLVGWADQEVLLTGGGPFEARHGDYRTLLKYPTENVNEYFLIENRTRRSLDGGLPDTGLAVYHCDTLGSNEWQDGAPHRHYQCALLQADGHLDLENNRNRGDDGDLYPEQSGIALSHETAPNSRRWDGSDSGLVVSDIDAPGGVIAFRVGSGRDNQLIRVEAEPDLLIPDYTEEGVRHGLQVNAPGRVKDIRVGVGITHPWISDLVVALEPPGGESVTLHDRSGQDGDDIDETYGTDSVAGLRDLRGTALTGEWRLHVSDRARRDVGRLDRWFLELEADRAVTVAEFSRKPNLQIPDDDATGVADAIDVAVEGRLTELRVGVHIEHTYIGDLRVDLVAPSGQAATLHLFEGGARNDLQRSYDTLSSPQLGQLVGQAIQGSWTLRVQDRARIDVGRLVEWSLAATYEPS